MLSVIALLLHPCDILLQASAVGRLLWRTKAQYWVLGAYTVVYEYPSDSNYHYVFVYLDIKHGIVRVLIHNAFLSHFVCLSALVCPP